MVCPERTSRVVLTVSQAWGEVGYTAEPCLGYVSSFKALPAGSSTSCADDVRRRSGLLAVREVSVVVDLKLCLAP